MEIIHIIVVNSTNEKLRKIKKSVYELITQQVILNKKVSLWGISSKNSNSDRTINFNKISFKAMFFPWNFDRNLKKNLYQSRKNIIVHLHGGFIFQNYFLAKLLIKYKIAYVFSPEAIYNSKLPSLFHSFYFNFFEKKILQNALSIHCIGSREKQGLLELNYSSKIVISPYGLDSDELKYTQKLSNEFVIGYLEKNSLKNGALNLLIKSFKEFNNSNSNSKLLIIADTKDKKIIDNILSDNLLNDIIQVNTVSNSKDKREILSKVTVLVQPSIHEGISKTILRACNSGLPVIVSDKTNLADSITKYNAGIVYENDNIISMKNAFITLHGLWKSNELKIIGDNGVKMINEVYNWNHIVNQLDKLYTK